MPGRCRSSGRIEPAVRAVLEEACRAAPALDDALRARLYARLAGDLIAANEVEQGERVFALCDEAAAAARRAGARRRARHRARGHLLRGGDAHAPGARAGRRRAQFPGDPRGGGGGRRARVRRRDPAPARHDPASRSATPTPSRARSTALATAAAASRAPEALWLADALAALRATVQGRFAEARDAMERALATGRRMQLPNAVGVYARQRIMWHAFQGRLAEIAPEIEAFVETHPAAPGGGRSRARPARARRRRRGPRRVPDPAREPGSRRAERGVMSRCYLAGLAALCVALRDREHAPMLYDRVARRKDVWIVDGCQTLGPWALAARASSPACAAGRRTRPDTSRPRSGSAGAWARRPFVARAQSLLASAAPVDATRGRTSASASRRCWTRRRSAPRELGLVDVTARVERLQREARSGRTTTVPPTRSGATATSGRCATPAGRSG